MTLKKQEKACLFLFHSTPKSKNILRYPRESSLTLGIYSSNVPKTQVTGCKQGERSKRHRIVEWNGPSGDRL